MDGNRKEIVMILVPFQRTTTFKEVSYGENVDVPNWWDDFNNEFGTVIAKGVNRLFLKYIFAVFLVAGSINAIQ